MDISDFYLYPDSTMIATQCQSLFISETGVEFSTFDILTDEDIRQGLKKFSNWPTYPQVYVKGELIGGLDIIKELKEGDELISTLKGQ